MPIGAAFVGLGLLGCGDPPTSGPPVDTGPFPQAPCPEQPCVADVALGTYAGAMETGHPLAGSGAQLYVASPGDAYDLDIGWVYTFVLPSLTPVGAWRGSIHQASFAAADIDGDGVAELAIGRPSALASQRGGLVHLLPSAVSGERSIEEEALLTIEGDGSGGLPQRRLGASVVFAEQATELWVSGGRGDGTDGRVFAFSTGVRGTVGEGLARRSVVSAGPLGAIAAWDGDRDGTDDLVLQAQDVGWFRGPWLDGVDASTPDAAWTDPDAGTSSFGWRLQRLGDVTGDGAEDLGVCAPHHATPAVRAGRVYVIDGVDGAGPAADVPLQVHGVAEGDTVGYALASADVDGDGQADLAVSALGVGPGAVLVFRGPVPAAALSEADATARVYAEHGRDGFGLALAAVDADGDAAADLAVGAAFWPDGAREGAVYLVPGGAWAP